MKKIFLLLIVFKISFLTAQNYIRTTPKNQTVSGNSGEDIIANVRINSFGTTDESIHFSILPIQIDEGLISITPHSGIIAKPGDLENIEFKFRKNVSTSSDKEYKFKVENVFGNSYEEIIIKVTYNASSSSCNLSAPSNLNTGSITENSARISWSNVTNANKYQYQYKKRTASSWTSLTTTSRSATLSNLQANQEYSWRVRARCSNNVYSSRWSSSKTFKTLQGCQDDLTITEKVDANETDNQSSKISITAKNIIENRGIANYDAGSRVLLKPGFKINRGGKFKGFIEGCSTSNRSLINKELLSIEIPTEIVYKNVEEENILVYPNPFIDEIKIDTEKEITSWSIYNLFNRKIKKGNEKEINTSDIVKGIYTLNVRLKSGKIVKKKIIKH